jgi:hypothetical protein
MNYDIKIVGAEEDNGKIEFDRLAKLIKTTKDIATKTLMLKMVGYSEIPPHPDLKKALHLYLSDLGGNAIDGTAITIDCINFKETIKGLQLDLFKPKEQLLNLTPMALVIESFHAALIGHHEDADLDKPLLKSLQAFKANFISDNEIFYLANRGTLAEVKLTKNDFQKINLLEESIPDPNRVIVNGKLDEIKVSKGRLGLQTDKGILTVIAKNESVLNSILEYIGKEITISGMAHYKPNGQVSFVEVQEFGKSSETDKYFSKKPSAMNAQQQLLFQAKQGKGTKTLEALINAQGLLDDVSDEEFNEILKSLK